MANPTRTRKRTQREPAPWRPPRGIRFYERADRPNKPFYVQYREPGKAKPKTLSYASAREREVFAKRLVKNREKHGPEVLAFDPVKWKRFLFYEKQLGGIDNFPNVVKAWNRRNASKLGPELRAAVPVFLHEKDRQGISRDSWQRYERLLGRLMASFKTISNPRFDQPKPRPYRVGDLGPDEIRQWIEGQSWKGKAFEARTKENWRKWLRAFFQLFVDRRELAFNPCDGIRPWGVAQKPVGILTPQEAAQLFEANAREACIGRLALEAFAGLRYSSAKRLLREHIDFEEEGIELPAGRLKTAKRMYVDGFPEMLWLWLRHAPEVCWELTERQYQAAKLRAFERAGVPHPDNCLRHSFCTYHIAKYKDVARTATLLCHTNLRTLHSHYRGNAAYRQAVDYFGIRP